jgi:transglutaminase-like putative cysteine protease
MKKIFFYLCLLFTVLEASSQSYTFDSIPDNLKRRADAVIRSEQCLYTIIKPGNATEKVKVVVTLLNEKSDNYRDVSVYYDKFSRINYIKGAIYDEKGKIIKVLGILDVYDESALPGGSFYSDDRKKYLDFPKYKYPYTIEYEYEKEYSSILNYPYWHFQYDPEVSVERSGIQFIVPREMKFRYYAKNLKNDVDSVITSDTKVYTWQEENIPASVPQNYYSLRSIYTLPVLFTAPLDFEYGGYKGSMSSWKTFGEWNYNLIKGLDDLPQTELAKVSEITSKTQDTRERAKLIYEYVQSRTRYVSIQIGIGGYRPAEASAVAMNGFGDCKALVNYTKALLKAAGINSYYTVIKSGEDKEIRKNFVANQFDHIILCVPMQKDTVWLECTSPTLPFNYLSSFTDDRYALLITPEGGKLVRTPEFKKSENVFRRTGSVSMYAIGSSLFKISNSYSGYNYGNADLIFGMKSEDELKRYLYSDLRFYDFNVSSVSYIENKSEYPSAIFSYGISVNDFTIAMGKRIYFNPSIEKDGYLQDYPSTLIIPESEIKIDSISYNLPFGYKVEFLPSDVILESEFGKFRYQLVVKNDKVIYKRYLEMNKGVIPLEKFYELRKFVNTIAKADRGKIILSN